MSSKAFAGDFEAFEADGPKKRGYTTRGKVEQERAAAPKLIGKVRSWQKRYVKQGKLTVMRWQRTDEAAADTTGSS